MTRPTRVLLLVAALAAAPWRAAPERPAVTPAAAGGIGRAVVRSMAVERRPPELVDRFVRAGAQYVFVGPGTGLRGPPKVVMVLGNHDDHLHVRIRPGRRR